MNTIDCFAPVKTTSDEAQCAAAASANEALRGLNACELQLVSGGDVVVGIR